MSGDAVSEINLWCQKNHQPLPKYTYIGMGTEWSCHLTATWLPGDRTSKIETSKKLAKQDVANQVLMEIQKNNNQIVELNFSFDKTIIMIDGDQRMDCWKWLVSESVNWNVEDIRIMVFISPTTQELSSDKGIEIIKTKTTNKDSADALMLMTLGRLMQQNTNNTNNTNNTKNTRILIVSSDHILVQAAQDSEGVDWVANLKQLQEYCQIVN
jgi:hypothetical protein